MARFKCVNNECSEKDNIITIERIKWVWSSSLNKLVTQLPVICKECGYELEFIKNETIPNVCINKFDSMSPSQKREVIKKRSSEHMRKTGETKEIIQRKKENIEANKRMVTGGK